MTIRDVGLIVCAASFGAVIALLADNLPLATQANAAALTPPGAAPSTRIVQASIIDDRLWGFHVDGDRVRTCTSSTNSRTLTPPRCSEWTR